MRHSSWHTLIDVGRGMDKNEAEWPGKAEFPALGKACKAMFWHTPGLTVRTFDSSGFSAAETLISASHGTPRRQTEEMTTPPSPPPAPHTHLPVHWSQWEGRRGMKEWSYEVVYIDWNDACHYQRPIRFQDAKRSYWVKLIASWSVFSFSTVLCGIDRYQFSNSRC